MQSFGNTIRALRKNKMLSLAEVAKAIEVDLAVLSKAERDKRKLTKAQVIKLANYFNTDANELLSLWLSDKLIYEIGADENAIRAMHLAEERIAYLALNKVDRKKVIKDIQQILANYKAVSKAWIFGSFARKDDDYQSDIDILIDVPKDRAFTLFDIAEIKELIQQKVQRKTDVVMLSAIKQSVNERIHADLQLIYEA